MNFIASPSRDKNGNVTTSQASYIGDLEAIVEHAAQQLIIQAIARGSSLDHAAARAVAEAEILVGTGHSDAETPPVDTPVVDTPVVDTPVVDTPKPTPSKANQ